MERFWSKVDRSRGSESCWEWQAACFTNGYGTFRDGAKQVRAHRFAFELEVGPIADGMQVNHHCDNRRCVNPAHLYQGTHDDNMRDRSARQRVAIGTRNGAYTHPENRPAGNHHGRSKLTDEQRAAIRRVHASGEASLSALARNYNVTPQCIWGVVRTAPERKVA